MLLRFLRQMDNLGSKLFPLLHYLCQIVQVNRIA